MPSSSGRYTDQVTTGACTGPMSDIFFFTMKLVDPFVTLYPNPATTTLNIVNEDVNPVTVEIFSIRGKKIATIASVTGTYTLNVSGYAKGVYVVYVIDQVTHKSTRKLVFIG
jgi:hypothetical protein